MADAEIDTLLAKLAATPRRRNPAEAMAGTERYEIVRRLGGGGFGDVYEARDREHGHRVALKALRSSEPDWIYRFKREFRVVGDMSHPNIARLYELFCENDRWYLTMELIDGISFDDHVDRAPDQLRGAFGQLALGLVELHRAGCLHRDVKPSNALVESTGRVVLLDFGLALQATSARMTRVAGTPPFMAPELAIGGAPTEAADWYAFGVMLYEALAGRLPFDGTETQILDDKLRGAPRAPIELAPHVDEDLSELAMRLLARDPVDRPSGAELVAILTGAPPARAAQPVEQGEVVGRDRELARLDEALAIAHAGNPVVVTIHGEPGIGKTTLVRAFADARADDVQLYCGRCHQTESVPYKGLDGAVDAIGIALSRRSADEIAGLVPPRAFALTQMFPVLKRVRAFDARGADRRIRSPHDIRRAGAMALSQLLGAMGRERPLAIFIDDLQWASDDSVGLLLDMLVPPAPPVIAIVAYRRADAVESPAVLRFLEGLASRGPIERIDLPVDALDAAGVEKLLASRGRASVPADRAIAETGGHPYMLCRLAQGDGWSSGHGVDLAALLEREIAALPAGARGLLEIVALSAGPVSQRVAFAAAGLDRDPSVVDRLRRLNLVSSAGTGNDAPIEPYHDRVREVTVDALAPDRLRELHRALAEALEAVGRGEPEELAHHYRAAGELRRALDWTRRAAIAATASLAFGRAAELYQEACHLAPDDRWLLRLMAELADAQVSAGRRVDAGDTCLRAAHVAQRLGDDDALAAMRARAGEHFLLSGKLYRGLELMREALAEVGIELPEDDATAVALSFNLGGELATYGLDFTPRPIAAIDPDLIRRVDLGLATSRAMSLTDLRAPLIASHALRDALRAGDPVRVQRALCFFVLNNSARAPSHPLVGDALARARELTAELADGLSEAWMNLVEGMLCIQLSDFTRAILLLEQAEQQFHALGPDLAREAAMARIALTVSCGNFGVDLPRSREVGAGIIEEAMARGDIFSANWARLTWVWTTLAADEVDRARGLLEETRASWPRVADSMFSTIMIANEIAIALYADPAGAWQVARDLEPAFRTLFSAVIPLPKITFGRLYSLSAVAALVAGRADRDEVERTLHAQLDELADATVRTSGRSVIESILASLAGDRDRAIAAMQTAAERWAADGQRLQELNARLRLAELQGDEAARDQAIEAMRELGVIDPDRYSTLYAGPRLAGVL